MEERVMGFKDALKAAIGMESEDEIEVSEETESLKKWTK